MQTSHTHSDGQYLSRSGVRQTLLDHLTLSDLDDVVDLALAGVYFQDDICAEVD